ncbi:MAG TPA: dihydrodipicolinate synthase family protein [Streptosporangiaceae bacterium]|jgi:dihydrodipicolinate synthase/N-acetylneuraminate lyase|nr:dihydrodipicolinate synthase family protein [Streptosporangiaceae bacterium]
MATQLDVITAVPTPFTASGELDLTAAARLFRLVTATTGNMFVAGTTGEFPALDDSERLALFEAALGEAGPDHVIAHIGAPDARHARRLAAAAVAAGARRLAAITPYYLPASDGEILAYYREVAKASAGTQLYAYLFPERTGVNVTPQQLASLAAECGLAGAKLSGSAGASLREYAAAMPAGFRLYTGRDDQVPLAAETSVTGVVSGLSSAFPELYVRLAGALAGGRAAEAADGQATVERLFAAGHTIAHLKYALSLRGVTGPTVRMAAGTVGGESAAAVAALVAELAPAETSAS